MKVSYAWLDSYFPKSLFTRGLPKPARLAELFNVYFAEVEAVEKIDGDTVFEIKTLADRNHYTLCHRGIAREASVITKKPLKAPTEPKIELDQAVSKVLVNVTTNLCRRYVARRIEGITVSSSPRLISRRLTAVGARSINTIVDATNFVMFDIGQPLHAFDADKVIGGITVRMAQSGEVITILDGREITLKDSDMVIADTVGPLAIAGVKGGKRAEVTTETKNIIIESANFDPASVRRTAHRTQLRNDSSKRFENEITPELAGEAMSAVTARIVEMSGGKVGEVTDIYPQPVTSWNVSVSVDMLTDMIGAPVTVSEAQDILERQGCVVSVTGNVLTVKPPFDRLDMVIPEDIADEIARIRGYDVLPSVQTPVLPVATPIDATFYAAEAVKNILVEAGFSEVQTYALVSKGAYEVAYPLASDKSALRERIAIKLSESLTMNCHNADLLGLENIKLFEIGKVFLKEGEKTVLALGVLPVKKKKGITADSIITEMLAKLGMKAVITNGIAEVDFDAYVAQRSLSGTLSDLHFAPLVRNIHYKPFSAYPFITRDIAFFAPAGTQVTHAQTVISKALSPLAVKGPDLFDRFEKEGKVSYGFRIIFQSFERTLSDDEVNTSMKQVYDAVSSQGWMVR